MKKRNMVRVRSPKRSWLGIIIGSMKLGIMAMVLPLFTFAAMTAEPLVYKRQAAPIVQAPEPKAVQAESLPITNNVISEEEPKIQREPETNREKYVPVARDAAQRHGVDPDLLVKYVDCENKDWNPEGQSSITYSFSDPKRGIRKGEREKSYGLAMWHIPEGEVNEEQAKDPHFALDKMAERLSAGEEWRWKVCTQKIRAGKI